jgi:hypothetical protein
MQERKFNSAFRVSSKKCDSLKMQNSLDQLLGAHSRKMMGDRLQDSDIETATPPSTSTLIRCSAGSRNASKDKNASGFKSSSEVSTNSDFGQNVFTPELGLFAKLRNALEDLAQQKRPHPQSEKLGARIFADQKMDLNYQNPTIKLDKDVGFLQSIINSLTQQPKNYLPPFALETLKDESNRPQQVFYTKLEQLRSLDHKLAMIGQSSDNHSGNKKTALKEDNSKMDIQTRREHFQDISSLNSLDEEIEMNTNSTTQLNHLSISSASQLEDLTLRTVNSHTSSPNKLHFSAPDFSNSTLQQRLELHHAKNGKCKSENNEALGGRGTSKISLGTYPPDERIRKILNYKKKIIKWRAAHPPNRNFSGRSAVAGSKPRIKGKFVKKDEYQKYMETHKKTAVD